MHAQLKGYDCALGKEELKAVFDTLVAPHLTKMSTPGLDFDTWYATLDKWNRTMIYASELKKYLISVGYNKWGDINLMLPGLDMKEIEKTRKLSELAEIKALANPA
jgi:hypothetical protein